MHMTTLAKALSVWVLLLLLAILNGGLREHLLVPLMGTTAALPVSGILLSAGILLAAWFTTPWLGCVRPAQYWSIGVFWLAFTLLFEFGFGRFIQHREWLELLGAYTFRDGNLWPVVLLVTLVSPRLVARLRGLS